MKPCGTQLAASRSDGIGSEHGVAPWRASARIFEPEIEMKSSGRFSSIAFIWWSALS